MLAGAFRPTAARSTIGSLVSTDTPRRPKWTTHGSFLLRQLREHPEFHERGLLPRFLFAVPPSTCGYRPYNAAVRVGAAARQAYADLVTRLYTLPKQADGAVLPHLVLAGDALTTWAAYHDRIERDLREDGPLHAIREWGAKHPARVARLAGLLHLATTPANQPLIPARTVTAACQLGAYFEAHVLAAYDLIAAIPRLEAARRILAWIKRRQVTTFSAADRRDERGLRDERGFRERLPNAPSRTFAGSSPAP
jgi:replicative DNA helicase